MVRGINARAILASTLVSLLGCNSPPYEITYKSFEQHPVEQVFRDHDGYRTYFTDESKVHHERKYYPLTCPENQFFPKDTPVEVKTTFKFFNPEAVTINDAVKIIKDLKEGEEGYALVLNYRCRNSFLHNPSYASTYVEIHLSNGKRLRPGIETIIGPRRRRYRSHTITYSPMNEVK